MQIPEEKKRHARTPNSEEEPVLLIHKIPQTLYHIGGYMANIKLKSFSLDSGFIRVQKDDSGISLFLGDKQYLVGQDGATVAAFLTEISEEAKDMLNEIEWGSASYRKEMGVEPGA